MAQLTSEFAPVRPSSAAAVVDCCEWPGAANHCALPSSTIRNSAHPPWDEKEITGFVVIDSYNDCISEGSKNMGSHKGCC
jgi:hypothetical protein